MKNGTSSVAQFMLIVYHNRCPISFCQVLDSRGHLLVALGYGLWPSMVLISEIVQTFILADFCYYYIERYASNYTMYMSIQLLQMLKIDIPAAFSEASSFCAFPPGWSDQSPLLLWLVNRNRKIDSFYPKKGLHQF